MSESDVGRIVDLIMQNPKLIEEIRGLAMGDDKSEKTITSGKDDPIAEPDKAEVEGQKEMKVIPNRRADLIGAMKPFLSEERGRTLDAMLRIGDVLDLLKAR